MAGFIALFATSQIYWIVILILIDVILGIIAALLKKEFCLGKLAGFMKKGVLAYVLGFAVLELAAQALPTLSMITGLAYYLIILALVGSILNNVSKMGLKLPSFLTK